MRGHGTSTTVLSHSRREAVKGTCIILVELHLHVEWQVGVDSIVLAWTVAIPVELIVDVLIAVAITITFVVEALVIRCVARMGCSGERVLVSLHEVELRAEVTRDLVGIAVAPAISGHPQIASLVTTGHRDQIESSNAAALVLRKVNVPFNRATEQIWLKVLRVSLVEGG